MRRPWTLSGMASLYKRVGWPRGEETVLAYPRVQAGKVDVSDVGFLAVEDDGVRPSNEERGARLDGEIGLVLLEEGHQFLVRLNVLPKVALPLLNHNVPLTSERVGLEASLLPQFLHGKTTHGVDGGLAGVTHLMAV